MVTLAHRKDAYATFARHFGDCGLKPLEQCPRQPVSSLGVGSQRQLKLVAPSIRTHRGHNMQSSERLSAFRLLWGRRLKVISKMAP
jgi:hypothetical protein